MKYEECESSPQFYRVRGLTNTTREFLRFTVKNTHRYYSEGSWYVHVDHILELTQLAYSTSGPVNYAALPVGLQMQIAEEKKTWKRGQPKPSIWKQPPEVVKARAYSKLYLTQDAPDFVVQAVWKALARKHHPDRQGDEETFKELQEAYNKIKG